jgi:phosphoglycerate dehydrogenase-like enzyme
MAEVFSPRDLARLHETVDVVWGRDEPIAIEAAQEAMADVTAVVAYQWRYGGLPERTPNLRAIIDVGGGMPGSLDYKDCFARGIRVMSAAPAFGRQVAEMALGLALASSRDIVSGDMAMRRGDERWLHAGTIDSFLLYDQPVGMIGYGSIARSLRPLLAPFDCPISAYDPWLADGYLRSQGVQPATLEQLLRTSRVIFVLAVPSAENRTLLTRELLELIRPDAVVVLVSRAHVVDFDALTELVTAGRFKAAVDVFPTEPLPLDHPIRRASGAVLSAHHAGAVKEGLWELGEYVVDDLEAIARNLPPQRLQVAAPELIGRLIRK